MKQEVSMGEITPERAKEICMDYLETNPERWTGIMRATYAYQLQKHEEPDAHYFLSNNRECACQWCGQTREGVRWDWYSSPPQCQKRPPAPDIAGVIHEEEVMFRLLMEKAEKWLKEVDVRTLTGEQLFRANSQNGFSWDMLVDFCTCDGRPLTPEQREGYGVALESERALSRSKIKKVILVAK